ncbi:sulfatase-like hydrolase/transferase [uncultured Ruegeria sp.]|uniref:sulfatase-like hydrolase/transferase n=1 Tax=uncultured Ruegeria sp. TaxID=259304 RepID=UPI00261B98A0|nr:sulfatase-like hydrolase/transferase [uncultured Ruegeria sp.]
MKLKYILPSLILTAGSAFAQQDPIQHDGEFEFLRAQFGEVWDVQDVEIEARLAAIRDANGGKPPNVLYILIDDVSFGQMGDRKMNYVMGIETPSINQLATEGLSLMRMYTEPSCTPTRTAMLTGRHPVRAGVTEVKVALVGEGLPATEVTLPEILKEVGYNTVHIGKWHQGDIEESYPHNQGFDWAAFPLHQQVQLSLMTPESMRANTMLGYIPEGQNNQFLLDERFKPYGLVTGVEAEAGGTAHEVDMSPGEIWNQAKYVDMNERYQRQVLDQLERVAAADEPFFLQYWPLYPLNFVYPDQAISRNGGFHADKLQLLDGWIGDLLTKLEETGESDNTIVVLMADNGLMYHYEGTSGLNQLIYRGGKTQHLEGGVRTDAFIRWPGVIEAGSAAGDIFHVSDIFTTMARIAGATDYIPRDRVIDGIDQTSLLLNGEGNGRRDYVYVYEGPVLRSVVKQEFKMHLPAPGQPGAAAPTYNIYRDPREQHPLVGYSLWAGASFQDMVKRHQKMIAKYPHAVIGRGIPYEGIDNLRPETELTREVFMSWQQ